MANQKQHDQLEHTYSSYVMIRDVTLKTCQRRWTIGRRGERGSEISVLAARYDDDDDVKSIFIHINSSFSNNSVKHIKTLLFQTIQFRTRTKFSSIWPKDLNMVSIFLSHRSPKLGLHHQIQFRVRLRKPLFWEGGVLPCWRGYFNFKPRWQDWVLTIVRR